MTSLTSWVDYNVLSYARVSVWHIPVDISLGMLQIGIKGNLSSVCGSIARPWVG
jgi:hypothetical protein